MQALKGGLTLAGFLALTLSLMPVQGVLVLLGGRAARVLPCWYHRQVCRILGLRVHRHGEIFRGTPVLIAANHSTWLDIVVLSSLAPISFVAKREVSTWPFISWLAKLQRTIFVDRENRNAVARISRQMEERLAAGDNIVLFPEGTSSDGNFVLPFRSSLLAPMLAPPATESSVDDAGAPSPAGTVKPHRMLQTCAVAYTHRQGIPIGRLNRATVAWYGDTELFGHAWTILKSGPIDVHVQISPPLDPASFGNRKALTRNIEERIRSDFARLLRNGGPAPVHY